MASESRNCETCRWWSGWRGDDYADCHRHAPQPRPQNGCFPVTCRTSWCGFWEPEPRRDGEGA